MLKIRPIKEIELPILEDILYEAVFQANKTEVLPRNIIHNPEIWVYIDKFGEKPDDYCLVAEINNKIVGAVWIRVLYNSIKGYGNIDNQTPEFGIALFDKYRKQGIGTKLMHAMLDYMKEKGYKQASLSVDKNNYAVQMYQAIGFKIIEERDHDYLMLFTFT